MDGSKLKELRQKLNQIYLNHDVEGFRLFIKERAEERPEIAEYAELSQTELSDLMYSAKAGLIYLGDDWQEARNRLRMKQFWPQSLDPTLESMPICLSCIYFRTPPQGEEDPCMHLGASPADIVCPGYAPGKPA